MYIRKPKFNMTSTLPYKSKIKYMCGDDESESGSVEPCESVGDTDEPSCGIAIMDTDGEWIQVKGIHKSRQIEYKMQDTEDGPTSDPHETEPTFPDPFPVPNPWELKNSSKRLLLNYFQSEFVRVH
jgi:hypothetical protein